MTALTAISNYPYRKERRDRHQSASRVQHHAADHPISKRIGTFQVHRSLIPIGDSADILAGLESNESVQAAGSSRATDMISPEVGISQIAALVGADEAEPNDDFANANVLQIADYDADLLVRVGGVLKGKDDFDLYQLTFTEDFGKSVKFVARPKRAYNASTKIEVIDSSFSTLRSDSGYDPE